MATNFRIKDNPQGLPLIKITFYQSFSVIKITLELFILGQ